jgi:cysteine-rich repeat protein/parallel beta-helix repeat protein
MRLALAFITVAALATAARADTIISGGNLSTQTWTLANSPYTLQGDVTVIAGATLTIEAGVVVQATSGSDAQLAGRNNARVEITVSGALVVNGTSAMPVTFKSTSTTAGSWYGIIATSSATQVKIDHANVQSAIYGITAEAAGTVLQATNVSVSSSSLYGFWLAAGAPTLDTVSAIGSGDYGVYVTGTADPTLVRCVIRNNSDAGVYIQHNTPGHSVNVNSCTLNANGTFGVYTAASSGNAATVNVKSSIITNTSYGVYRGDSASWSVTYSNVWNNSSSNNYNVTLGANTQTSNPLYVSSTDLRLTSNSPSRFGAEGGGDQGALPYDNVATPGLYGVLWSNTTLTAAGSPYTAAGDLTVAPNVTLTIEPGVTLSFTSGSDIMLSPATHPSRSALVVRGTLVANGTPANPISIGSTSTTSGSWYGIELDATSHDNVLDDVAIRHAIYGIEYRSTGTGNQLSNLVVESASLYGYWLRAGSPTLDTVSAVGSGDYGFHITDSASPSLTRCIARNNSDAGVYIQHSSPGRSVSLTHCTLNANGTFGVYTAASSGNAATVTVVGSIITNTSYGVYRGDSAAWSVTYSNVWNNSSSNNYNVTLGANTQTSNPLYVSSTDLRLTSNSPSRFGAPGNLDQGALPYDNVATPGLYGVLWTNTTLTAAGGPYTAAGDLTVAPNVTLTLEPGVTLSFTSGSDIMFSPATHPSRGALVVRGTLVANGTSANVITIGSTSTTAGSWYGIELDATSHDTVLDDIAIRHAIYGVEYRSAGSGNVLRRITIESASLYGIWLRAGSLAIDALTAIGSGDYGVYVTDSASATLTNCVVRNNSDAGIYIQHNTPGRSVAITNCTLNANGTFGVYSAASSGNAATINVTNSIITNTSYGVYRGDSASWSVTYSDVWNNSSSNNYNVTLGAGTITANPQYLSSTDLRVASTSVAIDAGTTGPTSDAQGAARPLDGNGVGGAQWDMGAYEFVLAVQCGNGVTEIGETCDDGTNNGMYGHCNAGCNGMGPRCGDNVKNGPEQCDDGNVANTDECLNTCMNPTCGDGFVRMNVEACDDGNPSNTDACLTTCAAASCGDGHVRAGVEPCDDGNQSNTDACLSTCAVATCGDGFAQAGVEDCDDGNMSNVDACLNVCVSASCGDSFVQTGVEGCDDGNMIETDMCTSTCVSTTCGNGIVEGTVEQCDDGNAIESDACRSTCVEARCGDGAIHFGVEECDDGNSTAGDGCDEVCIVEGNMPPGEMPGGNAGCCETSRGAGTSSLVLALAVMLRLRRRRRR